MRPFDEPISTGRRAEIVAAVEALLPQLPLQREVPGADYLMEPADATVVRVGELKIKDGPRLRIGVTKAAVRPPFEWLYEITSDVTPSDYFKHYLVMADQIVLAHMKVLTPIDETEAAVIMADLDEAARLLEEL